MPNICIKDYFIEKLSFTRTHWSIILCQYFVIWNMWCCIWGD